MCVYKNDFDRMLAGGCTCPECKNHGPQHTLPEAYIHSKCHTGAGSVALSLHDGKLMFVCGFCSDLIARVAVCASEELLKGFLGASQMIISNCHPLSTYSTCYKPDGKLHFECNQCNQEFLAIPVAYRPAEVPLESSAKLH